MLPTTLSEAFWLGTGALCGMVASAPLFLAMWRIRARELHVALTDALKERDSWRKAFEQEIADVPPPTEMCGGCGLYMTPIEIAACRGAECANYAKRLESVEITRDAQTGGKKINVGLNSFLQSEKS